MASILLPYLRRFFIHPLSLLFVPALFMLSAIMGAALWLVPQNPVPYTIVFSFRGGPEYFGTRATFFLIPLTSIALVVVNWGIARSMAPRIPALVAVLVVATVGIVAASATALFGFIRFNNVF